MQENQLDITILWTDLRLDFPQSSELGPTKFLNGDKFDGMLKNQKREGYGVYKWKNGNIYEGEWKLDLRHGKGCMRYDSGDIY